jgi:hypothetical protein
MLAFIIIISIKLATECVVERADQNATESGEIPGPVGNRNFVLYADMLLVCACVCMYYVCTIYMHVVCVGLCVCVSMYVCMYVCMYV